MMLSGYSTTTLNKDVKNLVDTILASHDMVLAHFEQGMGISARIQISKPGAIEFFIHEFPGNCSSLIVSNIQSHIILEMGSYAKAGREAVEVALEIARGMKYGAVIASGNRSEMKDIMEKEFGFRVMADNIYNPHSGNLNFFLIKELEYEKI